MYHVRESPLLGSTALHSHECLRVCQLYMQQCNGKLGKVDSIMNSSSNEDEVVKSMDVPEKIASGGTGPFNMNTGYKIPQATTPPLPLPYRRPSNTATVPLPPPPPPPPQSAQTLPPPPPALPTQSVPLLNVQAPIIDVQSPVLSTSTSTMTHTNQSIMRNTSFDAAYRMVQPSLHLLFPTDMSLSYSTDNISKESTGSMNTEYSMEKMTSTTLAPTPTTTTSSNKSAVEVENKTSYSIISHLIAYPPDSIYFVSPYTLGIVDIGDHVILWVGDYYVNYIQMDMKEKEKDKIEEVDKEDNKTIEKGKGKCKIPNSNRTKIRILIQKLWKLAIRIANTVTNGDSLVYNSKVLLIKQYSPASRLLFTRIGSSSVDPKYLISQYCDAYYFQHTIRVHQLVALSTLSTNNTSIKQSEEEINEEFNTVLYQLHHWKSMNNCMNECNVNVFMELLTYLPQTESYSLMKYISVICPGMIQKYSNSISSTSAGTGTGAGNSSWNKLLNTNANNANNNNMQINEDLCKLHQLFQPCI